MKSAAKILTVSLVALGVLCGSRVASAADVTTQAAPTPATLDNAKLSKPVRDIIKMTVSGVPEDVVKSYINNSSSVFNLTAENIINLQGVGVSSSVTAAMLNHDKAIRDNAAAIPPQTVVQQPPMQQPNGPYPGTGDQTPQTAYQPVETQPVYETVYNYSDLSPYGNWSYLADYGWCWQPFGWLGYNYYPWGLLQYGCWWNCPGRGWCWFPGSHFHAGFGFGGRGNGFFNHGAGGFNHGFAGGVNRGSFWSNHGVGGVNRGSTGFSRSGVMNRSSSFGLNRSGSFGHSFSGVRSSGFSGGRMGGFSGGHVGGFGGGHFGGFSGGGHVGGGGFGGGHSGGGGRR